MANVWQANYWAGGSQTYNSSHNGYDSATGYCNLVGLGQMIAGRYGNKDNVTCLRFACNDANYSKLHFYINNYASYTGQGTVKILVRTAALSSVTKTALENLGTYTMTYTCVYSSSGYGELNEFDLTYNFVKGTVYYIYIWGKDSDTWRFRWYPPDNTYSGFAVTYTTAKYTLTLNKGTGVASFTGGGSYDYNSSVSCTATAATGYHLTYYEGTGQNGGSTTYTWDSCAGLKTHTESWGVRANRTLTVYAEKDSFTLTISAGTGTTITVKRGTTTLSNGATIYYGDVLSISISAKSGYRLTAQSHTNGNVTVTNNLTVSATAVAQYTLTLNKGTGVASFTGGGVYDYNSSVSCTAKASTGYRLTKYAGQTQDGSGTSEWTDCAGLTEHTMKWGVRANRTITAYAEKIPYTLTITNVAGATAVVKRGSETLANGSTIYYGDVLTITVVPNEHYNGFLKVNGSAFTSGGTHTVTGAVTVIGESQFKSYDLTISAGTGTTVTVLNALGEEESAGTGVLTYSLDSPITVNCALQTGYKLTSFIINNVEYAPATSAELEITGPVSVKTTATKITYAVTYNANGGTGAPSAQTKTHGTTLTLSSTKPTKANTSSTGYTITFNGNGGTPSKTTATASDTTSYTFKNWNTAQNGSGTSYNSGASYTANSGATLYAQYNSTLTRGSITTASITTNKPNTAATARVVTFDATTNGGSSSTTSLNSTATISYAPLGWYTAASGGTKVADINVSYTPTSTTTLYMQWNGTTGAYSKVTLPTATKSNTTNTRTVSFNVNGGSSSHNAMISSQTVTYSLKGWYTAASEGTSRGTAGATYTPSASEKLYAQFNSSPGAWSAITLPTPTRPGYKFIGWAESASASTGVTGSYTPSKSLTLYAVWEPMGLVYIHNGSEWEAYQVFIHDGSKWEQYMPYIYDGTNWELYS